MPTQRRTWLILAAVLLLLVGLAWWLWPGDDVPRLPDGEVAEDSPASDQAAAPPPPAAPPTGPLPTLRGRPSPRDGVTEVVRRRLIAHIALDPPEPCAGADVLVHVQLLPEAEGAKILIAGQPGTPLVVRTPVEGVQTVPVVARDFRDAIDQRRVPVPVRACPDLRALTIEVLPRPSDRVRLRVAASPLGPGARYDWDFGDGTREAGAGTTAVHDYAMRAQTGPASTFLVTVRGQDATGQTASGRATVALVNERYLASQSGTAQLAVQAERQVRRTETGVGVRVKLRNDRQTAVRFVRVLVEPRRCADLQPMAALDLPAGEVLGTRTVAAGEEAFLGINLAQRLGPDVCRVLVRLQGQDRAGMPVEAMFAVDLGTPGTARPVTDPAEAERIRRAIRDKGGPVTPEDLTR